MRAELLQLAADLARKREPFVLAMVVRREPYSSAQPGDMAIITADGAYHGWLGGNCTQPTVKREARMALADGKPRLVSLSPDPRSQERPGVTALPMTCHSGGSVDIYLEPMLPPPQLLIFGESPCARALARLGEVMGYGVEAVREPPREAKDSAFAVIATMGENDEESLRAAIAARCGYIAVVASRRRFAEMRQTLLDGGVPPEALDQVHNPAGLDLGARLPEEVALSILAEIVQLRRAAAARPVPVEVPATAIDPVCGMTVEVKAARHRATHQGQDYFFCNPRCREKFLADPVRFLAA
jgi:xanthine dehydrogenase accessory factor